MPVGTMVYHIGMRMNLIVCQVDSKGKIICVNPNVFDNDVCQTMTVDINSLVKGWRTLYN